MKEALDIARHSAPFPLGYIWTFLVLLVLLVISVLTLPLWVIEKVGQITVNKGQEHDNS